MPRPPRRVGAALRLLCWAGQSGRLRRARDGARSDRRPVQSLHNGLALIRRVGHRYRHRRAIRNRDRGRRTDHHQHAAAPPPPTGPAPSTAGELTAAALPVPKGWKTVALDGGEEEGFEGNGTWVHERDPRYAAADVIGVGCAPVTRDDYTDPVAALEGNYEGKGGRPGVGLAMQFADAEAATRYFTLYRNQVQACTTSDGSVRTELVAGVDGLADHRTLRRRRMDRGRPPDRKPGGAGDPGRPRPQDRSGGRPGDPRPDQVAPGLLMQPAAHSRPRNCRILQQT